MHISLDSALGQQRRLNQVGESITQIAPDPAAAYSLRSLTGSDPKVVRVRRESDNHEQDFTASDVSSGALQDFVNAQVTAPLDIQALSATGRDGDFLIAKAAYSLRSLGTRQATLAATGDTVARANGQFVAQVRRNVDGNLKSFTATEVTDGTLLSFVNESFTSSLPLDVQGSAAAAYSLRNLSSSYSGNVVEVRRSSDDTTQNFTATEVTDGTLLAFVGTSGSDNGFVKTWYDQSGNSNNAVQATASEQPKIVSAGALNADGGLLFDSSEFDLGSSVSLGSAHSIFAVAKTSTAFSSVLPNFLTNPTNGRGIGFYSDAIKNKAIVSDNANNNLTFSSNTNKKILSLTSDASNVNGFQNGTASSDNSKSQTLTNNNFTEIGGGSNFAGTIEEIIVYLSDQTDNRRAIEESIATNYSITLASFNRDGFVKTWYDQSVTTQAGDTATGNHATQATAANQPKIVSAGSLLTAGVTFDGGDSLSVSGDPVITASSSGVFSAFSVQTVATSTEAGYLYGNASTSNGSSLYAKNTAFSLSNKSSASLDNISRSDGQNLLSAVYNNGNAGLLVNGTGTMTDTGTYDFSAGTSDFIIGNRNGGTVAATFLIGSINEIIVYNSNQTDNRTAIEANIGEAYSIDLPSGVDPGDNAVDGFVETWYDQSGNNNNAVQATAGNQPKIVDAGSLLTAGVTFDGTDDHLDLTSTLGITSVASHFAVTNLAGITNNTLFDNRDSSTDGYSIRTNDTSNINFDWLTSDAEVANASGQAVYYFNKTSSQVQSGANGGTLVTASESGSVSVAATPRIGARSFTSALNFFNGPIQEFIVYATDQTANRSALETNIAAEYGITLS